MMWWRLTIEKSDGVVDGDDVSVADGGLSSGPSCGLVLHQTHLGLACARVNLMWE